MKNLLYLMHRRTNYSILAGSLLMGISFFLPWVTVGSVFSGYDLADMYSRMYNNQAYLRFASVPKAAFGIFVLIIGNAPKKFVYYAAPVLSLVPLAVLDGALIEFKTIHYGVFVLHIAVILIWIGAFTYKYQPNLLEKSPAG